MAAQSTEIPVRLDGLQLDERHRLQSVIWMVQRFVWILCFCLMLAALAGLSGRGGPLAQQAIQVATGSASLPRVTRRLASDVIALRFTGAADRHTLFLPDRFLQMFEVQTVTPRPLAENSTPGGAMLHLAALGAPPHHVTVDVRARGAGVVTTTLGLDGVPLPLRLIILP